MSMTVFSNEVRAGSVETDRLVTYQPSADPSMGIASCIDMVVAVKGRYTNPPSQYSSRRFDKFMAHMSFGKTKNVPLPGYESNQGSLEDLEHVVECAKRHGLTGLRAWVSILSPVISECEDESLWSLHRYQRALNLLERAEGMLYRLGGSLRIMQHPAGLLKVELRSDDQPSSFDGLDAEQGTSDGIPLATYQGLVRILR